MKIVPVNDHVVIKPVEEKTAYLSSQTNFEDRGEVMETGFYVSTIQKGMFVFFDSWCAAKYKDGEGNEFWVVPLSKIRAYEG